LGMVAPAAGFVSPFGGFAIGLIAGGLCFFTLHAIKYRLQIDDSLDVFAIHGVGGIVGTVLTAIFAASGLGGSGTVAEGGIWGQLTMQLLGVAAVLVWSAVVSFVVLWVLNKALGLRVSQLEETEGLDIALHNEQGYNL
jgi:ammonium transporter, Amt family